RPANGNWADAVAGTPRTSELPWLPQAEALGWSPDGRSLYATGEFIPAPLYRIDPWPAIARDIKLISTSFNLIESPRHEREPRPLAARHPDAAGPDRRDPGGRRAAHHRRGWPAPRIDHRWHRHRSAVDLLSGRPVHGRTQPVRRAQPVRQVHRHGPRQRPALEQPVLHQAQGLVAGAQLRKRQAQGQRAGG